MTDKQINIVEILAEQCKNCTLYEGDTVSLNISIFNRQLKGVCFNNNIYFSVDELNYIMQKLISKEQECKELKVCLFQVQNATISLTKQLDQLKAEVKSKTEYIQEQRDIINQYSKEIEMYKKCQGKRASKREEELKAENDNIKETFDGLFKVQYKLADNNKKLRQCLTEIKEIAKPYYTLGSKDSPVAQILQKISEVNNDMENN